MSLKRRDVLLCGIAFFVAWGYAITWIPSLRWTPHAFVAGCAAPLLGLVAVLITVSTKGLGNERRVVFSRPTGLAFLQPLSWEREIAAIHKRNSYTKRPLYAESFIISTACDELLDLMLHDFIHSWYSGISENPGFTNEVDKTIRASLINIRDRVQNIDLVDIVTSRFVPILTTHFRDFCNAEKAVRGKHLNHNVTESDELDLAIAGKYAGGKLHNAASLAYADTKIAQQEYLRHLVKNLLPQILPPSVLSSRAVLVLIEEIIACAVLFPIMQLLSDPDTWNQMLEAYGRTMLQDRSTIRKLRAALDEHASPAPKADQKSAFPHIMPGDNERKFERYVRAIRKVNNLSDARRFRSEISSQLRRDAQEQATDALYLKRLGIGKKLLDHKVNQLAVGAAVVGEDESPVSQSLQSGVSRLENASLVDLLRDSSSLSYFMEYMDRQQLMSVVQFWIVVDGFRTPLEDDATEELEFSANMSLWSDSDRTDLAQIYEAYMSKPELQLSESVRRAVRDFLKAGKDASPRQYYAARRAILRAQTEALERMQVEHFDAFKKSDLYYKCLTTQEVSTKSVAQGVTNPFQSITKITFPERTNTRPGSFQTSALSRASARLAPKMKEFHPNDKSNSQIPRISLDSDPKLPFPGEEYVDERPSASNQSSDRPYSPNVTSQPDNQVVEAMEAALNNIMENSAKDKDEDVRASLFGNGLSPDTNLLFSHGDDSPRGSFENHRAVDYQKELDKPSIASLGLVNTSSRIGVFTDDDLFPDEEKFISDEHEDPADENDVIHDEIHEAAPGDLGLAEAIAALTVDIERLNSQNAVIDTLTRKAELTNNTAELRILRKSKSSMQREIRRKGLQRQQYIVQESDNSLYGRSSIRISSIMVGKEEDGREYAVYVIEVHRKAGEQMPSASWAVTRRYSEFHDLHQRLREKYTSVRLLEFPRRRMVMKLQNDFLNKRRFALEKYLRELLLLPDVCRSRNLRAFLSQSAITPGGVSLDRLGDKKDMMTRIYNSVTDSVDDILGNIPVLDQLSSAGQNLISVATSQLMIMPSVISEDPVTAAEAEAELNAYENRDLEPFVKPICDIFLEIFELNRGNNWLRGRAVVVVLHQLLGGTIERRVRDSIKGLVQEESMMLYISILKETIWPGGLRRESKPRTNSDKKKSRVEASLMLATLVPDLAASVVGRANAQAASRRIFATLNNPRLNAHLAFTLLDEAVNVLFSAQN